MPMPKSTVNFSPGFARRRLDAVVLLEQQDAESVEAGVLQREAILGFVHAEAARPAGASGEEDVVIDDFLARNPLASQALAGTGRGSRP